MQKRIVFDLDGTLIDIMDFKGSVINALTEFNIPFTDIDLTRYCRGMVIYEEYIKYYAVSEYTEFLRRYSGLPITEEMIRFYIYHAEHLVPNEPREGVHELLTYLKQKNYSLAVLSNYFDKSTMKRIEFLGLSKYFDAIYGASRYVKPDPLCFAQAIESYHPEECTMIGDNYQKDYLGALNCGMEAILIGDNPNAERRVKDIKEIKYIL